MLGRYVAGTLLVLGAAMVIAPESPPMETADVTRARTEPVSVPTADSTRLAAAVPTKTLASAPATPSLTAETGSEELRGGIEEALVAALNLDDAEGNTGEVAITDTDGAQPATQSEIAALEAGNTNGVWQGLSDTNALTELNARESPNTAPAEDAVAGVDAAKMMYVTGNRVNVRSGPSTTFGIVGSVTEGQAVEIVSDGSGTWAEIRFSDSGETGFMSRNFLIDAASDG